MSVQTLLAERDSHPPQSPEWIICDRTAQQMQMHDDKVPPCEWAAKMQPQYGIAAE